MKVQVQHYLEGGRRDRMTGERAMYLSSVYSCEKGGGMGWGEGYVSYKCVFM